MRMNQALKGRHRFLADYAKACVALSGLNLNSILTPRVPAPAVACSFTLGFAAPRFQRFGNTA